MHRNITSRALTLDDLCEGDILIMLGPTLAATLVCCCGRSWGSSHVGQVMRLDGHLWLAESTPHSPNSDSNFSQWIRHGRGPVHDGVCATRIAESWVYYTAIDIYRPIGVTQSHLLAMRNEFLRLYGSPYKRVVHELGPACLACVGCVHVQSPPSAYDCSDLTYHLFDTIGHARSDTNIRIFGDAVVRPYDIPRVIACDRIGHAQGAYAIGDPRSLVRFTDTMVSLHYPKTPRVAHITTPCVPCVPCVQAVPGGQSVTTIPPNQLSVKCAASAPCNSPGPPIQHTCTSIVSTPIVPTQRSSHTENRRGGGGVYMYPIPYPMHRI